MCQRSRHSGFIVSLMGNQGAGLPRCHVGFIWLALAAENLLGILLTFIAFGKLAGFGRLDYCGNNLQILKR